MWNLRVASCRTSAHSLRSLPTRSQASALGVAAAAAPAQLLAAAAASSSAVAAASSSSFSCCRCLRSPSSSFSSPLFTRSFHSSPSLHIAVAGGRARSRKLAERAEAAAQQAIEDAKTSKLRQLLEQRAAEEAAQAEAESSGSNGAGYRKPKIKRKGRSFEHREAILQEVELKEAEQELLKLEQEELQEERERVEAEKKEQEEGEGVGASSTPRTTGPIFPSGLNLSKKQRFDNMPTSSPSSLSTDASSVAHIEAQLRALEESPVQLGNIGGLGFNSINLHSHEVLRHEVLEPVQLSGRVRKMGMDRDRRTQFKRIERVTEASREIIGRVLLEESIRIGQVHEQYYAQQRMLQQQGGSGGISSLSGSGKKKSRAPLSTLIDLRRTPTFVIHQVRYSTDLGWVNVFWTLGKEGFPVHSKGMEEEGEEDEEEEGGRRRRKKKKKAKQTTDNTTTESFPSPSSSSSNGLLPPLGPWLQTRRLVANTLEHVLKKVRFALGKGLDLRYTPQIKFTYDTDFEERMAREKAQEEHIKEMEQLEENLRQKRIAAGQEVDEEGAAASAAAGSTPSQLLSAKSRLLNMAPDELEYEDPNVMQEFKEMDEEYQGKWRMSKAKVAAQAEREKQRKKVAEKKRKEKLLILQAKRFAREESNKKLGIKPIGPDPFAALDPNSSTDPAIVRAQLKASMAALLEQHKGQAPAEKEESLKQMRQVRASLTMFEQLQALKKKLAINPVEELKKKMRREAIPHYPNNWRNLPNQFYKK